jgi:hypothetical protein
MIFKERFFESKMDFQAFQQTQQALQQVQQVQQQILQSQQKTQNMTKDLKAAQKILGKMDKWMK